MDRAAVRSDADRAAKRLFEAWDSARGELAYAKVEPLMDLLSDSPAGEPGRQMLKDTIDALDEGTITVRMGTTVTEQLSFALIGPGSELSFGGYLKKCEKLLRQGREVPNWPEAPGDIDLLLADQAMGEPMKRMLGRNSPDLDGGLPPL